MRQRQGMPSRHFARTSSDYPAHLSLDLSRMSMDGHSAGVGPALSPTRGDLSSRSLQFNPSSSMHHRNTRTSEEGDLRSPLLDSSSITSGSQFQMKLDAQRQQFRDVITNELKKVSNFVGSKKQQLESEVQALKRDMQLCRASSSGVCLCGATLLCMSGMLLG